MEVCRGEIIALKPLQISDQKALDHGDSQSQDFVTQNQEWKVISWLCNRCHSRRGRFAQCRVEGSE